MRARVRSTPRVQTEENAGAILTQRAAQSIRHKSPSRLTRVNATTPAQDAQSDSDGAQSDSGSGGEDATWGDTEDTKLDGDEDPLTTTPAQACGCAGLIQIARAFFEGKLKQLSDVDGLVRVFGGFTADTVFHRTRDAMSMVLRGADIPLTKGNDGSEERRRTPGLDALTAFPSGERRTAAAIAAHSWPTPVILYAQICRGVTEAKIDDAVRRDHLKFIQRLWERVGLHVELLQQAVDHGILNWRIPMTAHNRGHVYRMLVHGKYLEALLALHAIVPLAGVGAEPDELIAFERQATVILKELEPSLPINSAADRDPSFLRDPRAFLEVAEFITPRILKLITPALTVATVVMLPYVRAYGDAARHVSPALVRARAQAAQRSGVIDRMDALTKVAGNINLDKVKGGELLARFVYAGEEGGPDPVSVLRGNPATVARTSLSTGPDQVFEAVRPNGKETYSMQQAFGVAATIRQYIFSNNADAGAFSRISVRAMLLLEDAKFWTACAGLLQSYADGTPVNEVTVAMFGASLAECTTAQLRGVNVPEDQYRWTRSLLDLSLGAWTQGIFLAPGEAWIMLAAGCLVRYVVPWAGIEDFLWFTDNMLFPGTLPNLFVSLGYVCYMAIAWLRNRGPRCSFRLFAGCTATAAGVAMAALPTIAGPLVLVGAGAGLALRLAGFSWAGILGLTIDWTSSPIRSAFRRFVQEFEAMLQYRSAVTNLADLRTFGMRCWSRLGLGEAMLHAAQGNAGVLDSYQTASSTGVRDIRLPMDTAAARVARTIMDEIPLKESNSTRGMVSVLDHMHRHTEEFKTLPSVAPLVEAATETALDTFMNNVAVTAIGAYATPRLVDAVRSRYYSDSTKWWINLAGTPRRFVQHILHLGFSSCCRRRRPPTTTVSVENKQAAQIAHASFQFANGYINAAQEREFELQRMRQWVKEQRNEWNMRDADIADLISRTYEPAWKGKFERGELD